MCAQLVLRHARDGLAVDADNNILLTYQNDGKSDPHCIIRWKPDGTGGEFASREGDGLCTGVPHGLKITTEAGGKQVRLWSTGQTWKLFDLGAESVRKYGFPYYMIYRPDLHGLMECHVRRLQPDAIRLGAKVVGEPRSYDESNFGPDG